MLQLKADFIINAWSGYMRPYAFLRRTTSIHNGITGFLELHVVETRVESCVRGFHAYLGWDPLLGRTFKG